MTTVYSNWGGHGGNSGSYWGMGFMHSTATNFSANRNAFFLAGQHSSGNGSAGGDEYRVIEATQQYDVSDIGMSVGTTYYLRVIGQVHTTNRQVSFNNNNGTNSRSRFTSWLRHYKRNV